MFVFLKCCEMCENQSLHLLNSVFWEYGVKISSLNLIFIESCGRGLENIEGDLQMRAWTSWWEEQLVEVGTLFLEKKRVREQGGTLLW
jgi:hypothetical protein